MANERRQKALLYKSLSSHYNERALAMYLSEAHYDCTFKVEKGNQDERKIFRCNKMILSIASQEFKAMLSGINKCPDNQIQMNGVSSLCFDSAMRFIYGKKIVEFSSLSHAKDVALFAHKWKIKYLGDIAVAHFDTFNIYGGEYLLLYEICNLLGDKVKTTEYYQKFSFGATTFPPVKNGMRDRFARPSRALMAPAESCARRGATPHRKNYHIGPHLNRPLNTAPAEAAALMPHDIATCDWPMLEVWARNFLTQLCINFDYNTLPGLQNSFIPYQRHVDALVLRCRVHDLILYRPRMLRNVDDNIYQTLGIGFKKKLRPMRTRGRGDCYFSSLSWVVTGGGQNVSLMRLVTMYSVVKYPGEFDNPNMRVHIAVHHGPEGALSLARSIGALGQTGLNVTMNLMYPGFVHNFHYASSPVILASSVSLKAMIISYQNLQNATRGLNTIDEVQQEFQDDLIRLANQRRFGDSLQIKASHSYTGRIIRVYCINEHFVSLLRYHRLDNKFFVPCTNFSLQLQLNPEDL